MKLKALPTQILELSNGVLLKRGAIETRICGEGAKNIVTTVLNATTTFGATLEEICRSFSDQERPAIEQLIDYLKNKRILVPLETTTTQTNEAETSLDVFYWQFGTEAARVLEKLNNLRITILGLNCISRQLASAFCAAGMMDFEVIDHPLMRNLSLFSPSGCLKGDQWSSSLPQITAYENWIAGTAVKSLGPVVATSDFGCTKSILEWNKICVEYKLPFFPVFLQNMIGYVGPLVIPDETACLECLRARQNSHLEDSENLRASEEFGFEGQRVHGFHPSMATILGDIAALELTKFYSHILPMGRAGMVIQVNLLISQMTTRRVLKIPRCSVCSPLNTFPPINPKKDGFMLNIQFAK